LELVVRRHSHLIRHFASAATLAQVPRVWVFRISHSITTIRSLMFDAVDPRSRTEPQRQEVEIRAE